LLTTFLIQTRLLSPGLEPPQETEVLPTPDAIRTDD
jgi:hypothetical protein